MRNIVVENHFRVMPADTNYMTPLIFGGKLMSEMDLLAATAVKQALTRVRGGTLHAVTHKADFTFEKPSYLGDTIYMTAWVADVGKKSVVVGVTAEREPSFTERRMRVATAKFVFVAVKEEAEFAKKPVSLPYCHHGLTREMVGLET